MNRSSNDTRALGLGNYRQFQANTTNAVISDDYEVPGLASVGLFFSSFDIWLLSWAVSVDLTIGHIRLFELSGVLIICQSQYSIRSVPKR